jgi:hypothetical protein
VRKSVSFAAIFVIASAWAHAQVVPEATGRGFVPGVTGLGGPAVTGNVIDYSLRYSQTAYIYTSGNLSNESMAIASGSFNYTHPSDHLPLNLNYIGGYIWPVAGPDLGTGVFQRLVLDQGFIAGRWSFFAYDNLTDTPEAPTVGFSGVAGTGEPIGGSGTGSSASPTILNINTRVVSNLGEGELGYKLGTTTTLNLGAGSEVFEFPNGGGLNTNGELANAGITRYLSSRTSLSGQYLFSHVSFGASPYSDGVAGSYDVSAVPVGFQYSWTRNFTVSLEAGPQWVSSSYSNLAPPITTVMVNASASERFRTGTLTGTYDRGVEASSGYFPAAVLDSFNGNYSQRFGRSSTVGITGGFFRYAALQSTYGSVNSPNCGVQFSQFLGRYVNFSADYTAIDQRSSLGGSAPEGNILNGLYHNVSFSLAFSPREMRANQ